MSKFLLIFLCFCKIIFSENNIYILIHGTWATHARWYQEGGDFFDTLSCVIDRSDEIISFSWSGICLENERRAAAFCLVELLKEESEKKKKTVIIAHSHGGNVVLHALELLHHHYHEIFVDFLILLGTPIAHNYGAKNISVGIIINLFSFGDLVQPVFGLFKRTMCVHNVLNFELIINNKAPMHNQLYHSLLAFYIPRLLFSEGIISITVDKKEFYTLNLDYYKGLSIGALTNWQEKLAKDQFFHEHLLSYMLWGPQEPLYFLP